jgi:cell division protein FtsI (penicillin-binding protein 3)
MVVRRRSQRGHRFTESPVLQLALQGWRSRSVGLLLMGAFLALVGRGFYLQVINNDFLQEKGDSRYLRDIEVSASRGKITDRNGDMLAVSTLMKSVWAIPGDARAMPVEQKRQLATLLDMTPKELDNKIASDKTFVYVKRQVPPETADRIAALKLPGVHQEKEYRRYYPTGDMTAHIVGFTGVDDKGWRASSWLFRAACWVIQAAAASLRIGVVRLSRMSAR